MEVAPAHIDQIRQADDGGWEIIPAEESSVVADLQRIDKRLRVRRAKRPVNPFWEVYMDHGPDRPIERITTVQAHLNGLGVWEGLDNRIVKRFEYIDREGRSGYNLADALEQRRKDREKRARDERMKHMEQTAERIAFEVRRDLGLGPYKGRVFKPREI